PRQPTAEGRPGGHPRAGADQRGRGHRTAAARRRGHRRRATGTGRTCGEHRHRAGGHRAGAHRGGCPVTEILLAGLLALATPSDAERGRVVERIVAVVDGGVVLLSEVERVVDDYMRAEPPPAGTDPLEVRAARWREVLDTLIA